MHRTEGANFIKDSVGRNAFSDGPPGTIINAAMMNSIVEEICYVIESAGFNVQTQATDTRDQLWDAINQFTTSFEYIISSQSTFNSIIERVAANHYKIKDEYSSVFIKNISGGYACYGVASFLSGGDTWGYIDTNQTKLILCEGGTIFQFGDTPGYLNVNTQDFIGYNIEVHGSGVVAAALNYSFYLNSTGIKLFNPKTYNRKSNTNYTAFYSNVTDNTQFILNPIIDTIDTAGGTIKGFYQCYNINNPYITLLESTSGITTIFDSCKKIINYLIYNCTNSAESIVVFDTCYTIGAGEVNTVQHDGAVAAKNVTIFDTCQGIDDRNLIISSVSTDGAGGKAPIFDSCTFRSRNIYEITKDADYTITSNDDFDELVVSCNTASQYGLITITLLTGSESSGQKQRIRHGDNQGLVKVTTQGGNKIRYEGEELSSILLYMEGNYLEYHWNNDDGVYEVDKLVSVMKVGWQNRSDWTAVHMGNAVTYDDGSGTSTKSSDWTGMVISGDDGSGTNTAVCVYDSGGAGDTGILYFYDISGSLGYFTNNNVLTASNGETIDVNEASGSSKNIDYNLYHGFGLSMVSLNEKYFYVSSDKTEANTFGFVFSDTPSSDAGLGLIGVDTNSTKVQTGLTGITYVEDTGNVAAFSTNDYYLQIILIF